MKIFILFALLVLNLAQAQIEDDCGEDALEQVAKQFAVPNCLSANIKESDISFI
jgi:hypothetical protein